MIMSPVMNIKKNTQLFKFLWESGCFFFISPNFFSIKIGISRNKVKKLSPVNRKQIKGTVLFFSYLDSRFRGNKPGFLLPQE